MSRVLDLFFAPVQVPLLTLLRFVVSGLTPSRTTWAVLQAWCILKSTLYGLMAAFWLYMVATPEPSAISVLPTETIQAVVAFATYVLAALSWAHWRMAAYLRELRHPH